ncbi:unnamed protein product [Caenorhabditis sp. 36 PRJEB53466]|nr:unnamed protein product [Caenorhabditis sp. 36 PRJEB53466]
MHRKAYRLRGNRFLKGTGLIKSPVVLLNGYPLDFSSPAHFDSVLTETVHVQTTRLQYSIFSGILKDNVDIAEWWLEEETNADIVERRNQKITTAFNERTFINFNENAAKFTDNLHYVSEDSDGSAKNAIVTTWIVADFEKEGHRLYAAEVLKSRAVTKKNKVALINNPESKKYDCVGRELPPNQKNRLKALIKDLTHFNSTIRVTDICSNDGSSYITSLLGIAPGEIAVVSNGLIIGPLSEDELLTAKDFKYLEEMWKEKRAQKVAELLNEEFNEDVSVRCYSAVAASTKDKVARLDLTEFKDPKETNILIFPPAESKSPAITVTWIANPVSREAQQIVSLLELIHKSLNAKIEIIFNPVESLSEMPIKRFYRFVASNELLFDENGSIEYHSATFWNIPQKQLLTMSVETNDAWMIEVKSAEYDLDNIVLETAAGNVEGVFSLEHILFEGQALNPSGEAADGLELELKSGEKVYDTIVMVNLGYFQLKAEPGVWTLSLREGVSADTHEITEVNLKEAKENIKIVIDSFTGTWTKVVIAEKEGAERKSNSAIANLVETAKNFFTSNIHSPDVINVFSLASGHLYERFLRIMMISVMKQTRTEKVKFWLLKNYLSPKFKETISSLAEHYGFDYELVEYKWPKWLNQQTEKQRVMWGYKILFLDVLFPLNVNKIIFVDADQVVRADLQELMDLNLRGAPYAYTPFCESRKEMNGFRFWQSGYWKTHLMGRRYHISALYVVDLKKFRQFAAGDRLRGRYATLSSDPNSLSNLDQDLPNNMIHEVPIRTLPQEWLWCETWCDDESKKAAKTIDLCNNPLTKEPKLSSAQRIIGEWKTYDEEISEVLAGKKTKDTKAKTEL